MPKVVAAVPAVQVGINKITPALEAHSTPLESLTLDPNNARVHPQRNLDAIQASLALYGQTKPVVVREQTRVIVAGNGTAMAALALGWTEIAAIFVQMTDAEAAGYGLADNRTAELAKWDFEIVSRLDKLISDSGQVDAMIGWTQDELEVLRSANWVPPPINDAATGGVGEEALGEDPDSLVVGFTPDQYEKVGEAIDLMRGILDNLLLDQAEVLLHICTEWLILKEGEMVASSDIGEGG
jgi:hypothetical protein